jgi:hydroxymethylbilane synthase
LRPDLNLVDLRGNVPTRLRKLTANPWHAIILARAGLDRLGFQSAAPEIAYEGDTLRSSILATEQFVPAGGQGIIALQIRSDDEVTRRIIEKLNHAASLLCLRAEREFLRLLQGDCATPVGVLATLRDGTMEMRAQIFDDGHAEPRTAALSQDARSEPEALAAQLFEAIHGR